MAATSEAHSPRAPRGLNGLLSRAVKEARLRQALREIDRACAILDVGAGLCEIVDRLPAGSNYTGIERDPWMVRRAAKLFPEHRIIEADIERDELDLPRKFDRVLLVAVWEHLANPAAFLDRAARWIERGGALVLTTPSPLAHRIIDLGSWLRLLSRSAADEHEKLWTIEEIRSLAEAKGWEVVRARRFLFGLNQLIVLRPAEARESSPDRAFGRSGRGG